jgi:penicillin-binding protein 2
MNRRIFGIKRRTRANSDIDPDEIFLDSRNLPAFDTNQFEGMLEKPIGTLSVIFVGIVFFLIVGIFSVKMWSLQVSDGQLYSDKSENNRLRHSAIFGERGVIYDRTGKLLAWNYVATSSPEFAKRKYIDMPGLSHVLGYVKYPSRDSSGFYYKENYDGMDGVEKTYNEWLSGVNGTQIIETDALGKLQSWNTIRPPQDGTSVRLSIDADLQSRLYYYIEQTATDIGFSGGAGVIMDVTTGEILAITSYPEYDSNILSSGTDSAAIAGYVSNKNKPFLNRIINGLYTPGSIVKPFVALGALNEKIIDPKKEILSTGSITIQNQYDKEKKSVFTDWKAHGLVDMRHALAVSSNVYFYEIGGGFEKQKGLGIINLEKYYRMFGFGSSVDATFFDGVAGTIPNPAWKKVNFNNEPWRIGDTYFTAIGQYGFQIAPIQAVRAVAAVANGGKLLRPSIISGGDGTPALERVIPIAESDFQIVREGMRQGVLEGTGKGLNIPQVKVASKTGTAELGTLKKNVNSWVEGFFPYDNPKYAFVVMMESGRRENVIGGLFVMRSLFDWMVVHKPEYLKNN